MTAVTEFLKSLKSDLTDRRLLPLVGVAVVGLVAAVAYAALAGGSSSPTLAPEAPVPAQHVTGIAVTPEHTGVTGAVAETTNGVSLQRHGGSHNPFAPIAAAVTVSGSSRASTASGASSVSSVVASTTAGSSSGTSGSSTSSSASPQSSTPSTPSKPKSPPKPKTIYEVTVALGPIAPGSTLPSTELNALPALSKPTPLPSAKQELVEFMGVTRSGKGMAATFAVVGEVIMYGAGACVPSPTQCKLVNIKEGTSEQLEYIQSDGQPAALELHVQKIAAKTASAASFGRLLHAERAAAARRGGGWVLTVAGLHYSQRGGVLVYAARRKHG